MQKSIEEINAALLHGSMELDFKTKVVQMTRNYKDVRGVVFRKYRSIFGKFVLVMDENGVKTKIFPGKSLYEHMALGSKWTIGHIDGKLINIRPGFCQNTDECC